MGTGGAFIAINMQLISLQLSILPQDAKILNLKFGKIIFTITKPHSSISIIDNLILNFVIQSTYHKLTMINMCCLVILTKFM
jgi:hypothetical protein